MNIIKAGFLFLLASSVLGQTSKQAEAYLQNAHARGLFNGVVLLEDKGEIVFQKALGVANVGGEPLRMDHAFNLASVSKQFTAMAIMILADQGKLSFDDDITKHISELPYKGVTIRHLLQHTGGLTDYMRVFNQHWDTDVKSAYEKKTATNDDLIHLFSKLAPPIDFEPGAKWAYSNTGYALLASIVGRASGKPFIDFVAQNIFKPLEMKHSVVYSRKLDNPITNRVYGFRETLDGKRIPTDLVYLDGIHGDGAIYSTAADLLKWSRGGEKLVSKEIFAAGLKPAKTADGGSRDYGFGIGFEKEEGGYRLQHSGGWVGFGTFFQRRSYRGQTLVVLTNNSLSVVPKLVRGLDDILMGRTPLALKKPISSALIGIVQEKGAEEAVKAYRKLRDNDDGSYEFAEEELNNLGYFFMQQDKFEEALALFKLNVEVYPNAFNPHDSLGEAYMMLGQKKEAIASYERSLELNPKNNNARNMIQQMQAK